MDIYDYELGAFKREIRELEKDRNCPIKEIENLTHFSLGTSNRGHNMVVGLCSLVESLLVDFVLDEEKNKYNMPDAGDKFISDTYRIKMFVKKELEEKGNKYYFLKKDEME